MLVAYVVLWDVTFVPPPATGNPAQPIAAPATRKLNAPEELAFKEETVKVTLTLSTASVAFFKAQAKQHGTAYQAMIRRLLDSYAVKHAR